MSTDEGQPAIGALIETYLKKVYVKINKDLASRRHVELKKACDVALGVIEKIEALKQPKLLPYVDSVPVCGVNGDVKAEWDLLVHILVSPIQLGCETKDRKIVEVCLEALQRMLECGYIQGSTDDSEVAGQKLISRIIKIAEGCFDVSHKDDVVQQHILNVFSTAVEMSVCGVHESNLMTAVRICYNIYLISGEQNRKMAKQTLTHVLNLLFTRLHNATVRGTLGDSLAAGDDDETPSTQSLLPHSSHARQYSSGGFTEPATLAQAQQNIPSQPSPISSGAPSPRMEPGSDEGAAQPRPELSQDSTVPSSAEASDSSESTAPASPAYSVEQESLSSSSSIKRDPNDEYAYKDCFQTFRGLCKLSMKKVPNNITNLDSIEVRSKILSLELILSIFENSAYSFKSNSRFVTNAIQKHLVMSLLMNGGSSISLVFRTVMAIFVALVRDFRDHLKTEVEVFFSTVIFPVLDSSSSSLQQKIIVVRDLHSVCKNPQIIVDLFINYDCDPYGKDVFETMVKLVSKLTQRKMPEVSAWGADTTEDEVTLKQLSLKTLAVVTKSLADWSQALYEEPHEAAEGAASSSPDDDMATVKPNRREHVPDVIEQQKQTKLLLEKGKELFKMSHKKGMTFFLENGLVQNTHEDVSRFLRYTPGLDKTKIGELLGESDAWHVSVMKAYIDSFSFVGMEIDLALREFLAYFRIPGEGQKIDRLMEKFAERYFKDCPDAGFGHADACYLLAFSIIMLATDQHSQSVKVKMKREEWKRLLLGQNNGKDYDDATLDAIFARVSAEELKLKDDDVSVVSSSSSSSSTPQAAADEAALILERSKDLIKDKQFHASAFVHAENVEYAKPMLEASWRPLLAAFSYIMEDSNDEKLIAMCLEGLRLCVRVTCIFFMETERQTFIGSLAGFTLLENLREMKSKNIDCIRTILAISSSDGNYLGSSWKQVAKVISLVERMHNMGSGQKIDDSLPDRSGATPTRKAVQSGVSFEVANAAMIAQAISASSLDRIFTHSVGLSNQAIVDFVKGVCTVSAEELSLPNPRIFCLQKLVEIAAFNMNRIRMVWSQIWREMATHFTSAALHKNNNVAVYALDSLKQLALKFLDKEELSHFHFQKEFMQPFVDVYEHDQPTIRELVVHCLSMMMRAKASHLKSGWECLFKVFGKAAHDQGPIADLALSLAVEAREKHFDHFQEEHLVDYISCVACFATDPRSSEKLAHRALGLLRNCAEDLKTGAISIPSAGSATERSLRSSDEEIPGKKFYNRKDHARVWRAVLEGMSKAVGHPDINIRPVALETLTQAFLDYGTLFSSALLVAMFRETLLPVFDDVMSQSKSDDNLSDSEWLLTTCLKASNAMLSIFSAFFDEIPAVLDDLLLLIHSFIVQENETLATFGVTSFETLLSNCSTRLSTQMWTQVADFTANTTRVSSPMKQLKFAFAVDSSEDSPTPAVHPNATEPSAPLVSDSPTKSEEPQSPRVIRSSSVLSGSPAIKRVESTAAVSSPRTSLEKQQTPHASTLPLSATSDGKPVTPLKQSVSSRRPRFMSVADTRRKIALGKVRIQSLLVRAIRDRIMEPHGKTLTSDQLGEILDALLDARVAVREVMRDPHLKTLQEQSTLVENIIRLETDALHTYISGLFSARSALSAQALPMLDSRVDALLELLAKEHMESPRDSPNESGLAYLLSVLVTLEATEFSAYSKKFYTLFVELCMSDSVRVRGALRAILSRVGEVIQFK